MLALTDRIPADESRSDTRLNLNAGTQPLPPRLIVLTRRSEFLDCAKGAKAGAGRIGLQGLRRVATGSEVNAPIRFGVTASKKVGNAVARNRAKRRMRALARELLPELGVAGCDYVLIARPDTPETEWPALLDEARSGLIKLRRLLTRKPEAPKAASTDQAGSGPAGS